MAERQLPQPFQDLEPYLTSRGSILRRSVGTANDIRREMDLLVETANPEWFIRQSDQGYLPLADVKRMLQRFGKEILPHYL